MNIQVSPSLNWLRPYLELAKYITNIDKLERITAKKPRLYQQQHVDAMLYKTGEKFRMTIMTHSLSYKVKDMHILNVKLKPMSTLDILDSLAHELSHLDMTRFKGSFWVTHTPEHKIVESELNQIFALHAKMTGYESEEIELKKNRFQTLNRQL